MAVIVALPVFEPQPVVVVAIDVILNELVGAVMFTVCVEAQPLASVMVAVWVPDDNVVLVNPVTALSQFTV